MAVTALFAILLSAAISERVYTSGDASLGSFIDPKFLVGTAIRFAGVAVIIRNLRLSSGMWLVLIGYVGPWLVAVATSVIIALWLSDGNSTSLVTSVVQVSWMASTFLAILLVIGLAITFREVREKLANLSQTL